MAGCRVRRVGGERGSSDTPPDQPRVLSVPHAGPRSDRRIGEADGATAQGPPPPCFAASAPHLRPSPPVCTTAGVGTCARVPRAPLCVQLLQVARSSLAAMLRPPPGQSLSRRVDPASRFFGNNLISTRCLAACLASSSSFWVLCRCRRHCGGGECPRSGWTPFG